MNPPLTERLNAALAGRYRIERQLGEGGMATVFLATELRHQREVALKVLRPELASVVGPSASSPRSARPRTHPDGFDVALDDQRFLMARRTDLGAAPQATFVLVQNWFGELRRLSPN